MTAPGMVYRLTYTVQAPNQLMAWMAAGRLLRSTVSVREVIETTPLNGDWWEVVLAVEEAEPPEPRWLHEDVRYFDPESGSPDPIDLAKAEADRA